VLLNVIGGTDHFCSEPWFMAMMVVDQMKQRDRNGQNDGSLPALYYATNAQQTHPEVIDCCFSGIAYYLPCESPINYMGLVMAIRQG
jgi:hypothetical protein